MEDLIGVEVRGWYDGVAYYQDKDGNKFSRVERLPISENELCKHGKIYEVVAISDYKFKIISEREDKR